MWWRRLTLVVGLCLTACGTPEAGDGRTDVVASFYPVADLARRIGGDRIDVRDVTPPGAEPHDVEITTDTLDAVIDADLVLYLRGFQPALDDALGQARGETVDLLRGTDGDDPHIWLDPTSWIDAADRLAAALADADPDGAQTYERNAAAATRALAAVVAAYEEGLARCERDLVVTSHDAFGRLAESYDLRVESIAGVAPEAEPDPRRVAEIADLVRDQGVTTIFTETLVSPEVAETLADEADVRTDVLDPIESEPAGGYDGAMRRNLDALRGALGCR